ncbi:MAG: hypothetical protein WB816_11975 [Methylocystis sp.]
MPTLLEFRILDGDFAPVGGVKATILGLEGRRWRRGWRDVRAIGTNATEIEHNLLGGAAGALALGGVASIFFTPLAAAGAAVVGGMAGAREIEKFMLIGQDGRIAYCRAEKPICGPLRLLMEDALLVAEPLNIVQIEGPGLIEEAANYIDAGLAALPFFGKK